MYIVKNKNKNGLQKKKKKKKMVYEKKKRKQNGLRKKKNKKKNGKKGQSHWGGNIYMVRFKGNCFTVE